MYIKLGTLNLQYYQETNDWMIIAEILDSSMSFEEPILVRTTEELDIWFGRDFPDYNYMQEFLNMGVVLYLYKPISTITNSWGDGYIDLTQYTENPNIYLRDIELDWVCKLLNNPDAYKFYYYNGTNIVTRAFTINSITKKLDWYWGSTSNREYCTTEIMREDLPNQLIEIYGSETDPKISFHVYNSESLWIYYFPPEDLTEVIRRGVILEEDSLPQNMNLTSKSSNNRDKLIVTDNNYINYTYLDYSSETEEFGIYFGNNIVKAYRGLNTTYISDINMNYISEGYQTLVIKLSGNEISEGDYFVFPNPIRGIDTSLWKLFYCGDISNVPDEIKNIFNTKEVTNLRNLITELRNFGYYTYEDSGDTYLMSNTILTFTNFYQSSGVMLNPETDITFKILSGYANPSIKFVSKTIGKSSNFGDDAITVNIEKPYPNEDFYYRITISRYDYSETFEGSVLSIVGEDRLDSLISKDSKLVRCYLDSTIIRPGNYKMRGATIEEQAPEMYKFSMKKMLSTEYSTPVYPDYFLIPDKYKYTSDLKNQSPYNLFLEYAKEINCQYLIENNEEDYIENLTTDKDNRLVYFYKPMTYQFAERPGYYIYLRGLLLDQYSASVADVLYNPPIKDAFLDENIEKTLEEYKSNYLVCDNQTYFYKKYQNGSTYNTTGWARFVLGKVYRELQKHSGDIVGQQILGKVRSNISDILYSVESGFSIIGSIVLTEFEPSENGESLSITTEIYVNDLVNNNVSLNITVNYNNQ